ncbi:conjugal transfer pilus assembly protein TraU [Burkholderia stagnalis]|uniref:conjugal transfer pilus assembly protein TraU n=1 Tax=Burkholderia stagnalis TaxID=1503054 RepID=UPI000F5B9D57|nr:conjugal transfer pilus assembly protein TraU [Burkholderia stagnalis]RQQ01110.1 conjugal transfer protein [Burkholderia stagnalis]RQY68766.1 conjugal transfer protein [Burkholderia stagnalis]TCW78919.1 conjugal transfer protein [Burkholderia sp. SRS-46]
MRHATPSCAALLAVLRRVALLLVLGSCSLATHAQSLNCNGKFANPITDICWSCVFPISLGGTPIITAGQEDTSNPSGLLCACGAVVGLKIGFWEPVRRVDVTRVPYCFVSLGGVKIDPGIRAPEGEIRQQQDLTKQSRYQVHWYLDPILFWLEVLLDFSCLETGSFDVAYLTEIDPTWNDDELTMLLNPETFLFGNPIAQAACAGDCVLSSAGFGSNALFWCAGCNGSIYPFNGHVQAHISHVQASSLLVQRMTAKLHREGLMWGTSGGDALCGATIQPVMDKSQYKYQMLYPIPETAKIDGRCCQPYGRTTAIWGAGKSYPYKGEDFSYMVFRKKNCCLGVLP